MILAVHLLLFRPDLYAPSTFPMMHLICPPKCCITLVFHFSWVLTVVLRETENNAYAKFLGANKVYYRKCASGVLIFRDCLFSPLSFPDHFRILL